MTIRNYISVADMLSCICLGGCIRCLSQTHTYKFSSKNTQSFVLNRLTYVIEINFNFNLTLIL